MEDHLDNHPDDFEKSFTRIGRVSAVFPLDHPLNPTFDGDTGVMMYQVEIYSQFPSEVYTLDFVPASGQCTGGANDTCDPHLVGDWVTVSFVEGNINLPEIARRRFSPAHNSTVDNTVANYPQVNVKRNGVSFSIDKDGDFKLDLAEGKSIVIKDSAGNVLFEIIKTGGSYEVHLGGDLGLKRLITEDIVGALATVFTSAAVSTGDGGSVLKTNVAAALNATFATATSTSIVKAK